MLSLNLVQKLIQNKCILGIGCIHKLVIFTISSGNSVKEIPTIDVLKNSLSQARSGQNKW